MEIVNPAIPIPKQKPHSWASISRLEEEQLDILAERDIDMDLMGTLSGVNHILVCKAQWAARANTLSGRMVVNEKIFNMILHVFITPPALHNVVWSNLMLVKDIWNPIDRLLGILHKVNMSEEEDRIRARELLELPQFAAYHEDDIARAFQFIRFLEELYPLLGVSTPRKQLTALAGMLGIACLPAIYSSIVYPVMNNRKTSRIAENTFFIELCTAIIVDRENDMPAYGGITEEGKVIDSIRMRMMGVDEECFVGVSKPDKGAECIVTSQNTGEVHILGLADPTDKDAVIRQTNQSWVDRGYVIGYELHEVMVGKVGIDKASKIPRAMKLTWDKVMAVILPPWEDTPDEWRQLDMQGIDMAALIVLMIDTGAKGGIHTGYRHPNSERSHTNHTVGITKILNYVRKYPHMFTLAHGLHNHMVGGFTGGMGDEAPVMCGMHFGVLDAITGLWWRSPYTMVYLFPDLKRSTYDIAIGNYDSRNWGYDRCEVEDINLAFTDHTGETRYVSNWIKMDIK